MSKEIYSNHDGKPKCQCLTKRELLAGMAMQGMLATPSNFVPSEIGIAKAAVAMADALLAELEKGKDAK